jgi:uncharacterized protein (TIGR02391 family)
MTQRQDQVPLVKLAEDPDTLLSLEPEELAGVLLLDLIKLEERGETGSLHCYNYSLRFKGASKEVKEAIMEAWMWLEQHGCLAPRPGHGKDWVFITRHGKRLSEAQDTSGYQRENLLPKNFLHPVIAQKAWSAFIRGDYDVAVFQAFKQVEVAVRQAGKYAETDIGVTLMRKAFNTEDGPLTNKSEVSAEKQALSDLFAGAIGLYKNPHSHRNVPLNQSIEAAELIILASHLLNIVDLRSSS